MIDVSGNLACIGSKSAVVPVDGGARKVALYAVEAPENWFEDAGSARLAHGSAVVHLEPIFAQTVNSSVEYHVFLTPNGDCKGLYVTSKSADSFEVHELGGGVSSIAFDYRIMAHRKGYEAIRLADNTERFARLERKGPPVARPPHVAPARNTTAAVPLRPLARVRTPLPYVMQAPVVVKKKRQVEAASKINRRENGNHASSITVPSGGWPRSIVLVCRRASGRIARSEPEKNSALESFDGCIVWGLSRPKGRNPG